MLTKTQLKLITLVAHRLTGKSILVRQQEPATKGVWGEVHRAEGGQLIIDISPTVPEHKQLYVILHEIGHARRHTFIETKVYRAAPGTLAPNIRTVGNMITEGTADMQAAEWQKWGEAHANPDIYKAAPLEAVLIALLDHPREGDK